jgi:hypothetical protein
MVVTKSPKTRRLNIVLDESLEACISSNAKTNGMSISAFVRRAVERECARAQEQALAQTASSLADLYRSDKELTAFLALDGDDFA